MLSRTKSCTQIIFIWTHHVCSKPIDLSFILDAGNFETKIIKLKWNDDLTGFQKLPRRWVVERFFGWLNNYRRLSKDYEGLSETEVKLPFMPPCTYHGANISWNTDLLVVELLIKHALRVDLLT